MAGSAHRHGAIRCGALAALLAVLVAAAATAVQAQSRAEYVLGVSNTLVGNGWREEMICAIKAQALASGKVSKVIVANRNGGPREQNADLGNLVAAGVNAIVIKPSSPTALNSAIAYAASRGIKVVTVDERVTAPQAYAATTDQVAYGRIGASWLFRVLGGKGNVVEMRGTAGARADAERHTGFRQALRKYPRIKVVKSPYTGGSLERGGQQMRDILASGVKVDGVWTSGVDYAVTDAFISAGKPLVPIVGTDTNQFLKQLAQYGASQKWHAAAVTNPATIGGVAAAMAIRLLDRGATPRWVKLVPQVWDNQTAAGKLQIARNYSARQPPTYSARFRIDPWTTFTREQLYGCKGP